MGQLRAKAQQNVIAIETGNKAEQDVLKDLSEINEVVLTFSAPRFSTMDNTDKNDVFMLQQTSTVPISNSDRSRIEQLVQKAIFKSYSKSLLQKMEARIKSTYQTPLTAEEPSRKVAPNNYGKLQDDKLRQFIDGPTHYESLIQESEFNKALEARKEELKTQTLTKKEISEVRNKFKSRQNNPQYFEAIPLELNPQNQIQIYSKGQLVIPDQESIDYAYDSSINELLSTEERIELKTLLAKYSIVCKVAQIKNAIGQDVTHRATYGDYSEMELGILAAKSKLIVGQEIATVDKIQAYKMFLGVNDIELSYPKVIDTNRTLHNYEGTDSLHLQTLPINEESTNSSLLATATIMSTMVPKLTLKDPILKIEKDNQELNEFLTYKAYLKDFKNVSSIKEHGQSFVVFFGSDYSGNEISTSLQFIPTAELKYIALLKKQFNK